MMSHSRTRSALLRFAIIFALLLFPAVSTPPSSAAARTPSMSAQGHEPKLYVGGDLAPLLGVSSLPELIGAVTALYDTVEATDFPERAHVLADQIAATMPHVVGGADARCRQMRPIERMALPE
jgi:hypothetical protein